MFPKTGRLWKQAPFSRALISISFGVSSKGALPPGSLYRASTERGAPLPKPFIHLSKSLVNEPPLPGSTAGPLWREMPVSRATLCCDMNLQLQAISVVLPIVPSHQ
jgi:hypothetical protein